MSPIVTTRNKNRGCLGCPMVQLLDFGLIQLTNIIGKVHSKTEQAVSDSLPSKQPSPDWPALANRRLTSRWVGLL